MSVLAIELKTFGRVAVTLCGQNEAKSNRLETPIFIKSAFKKYNIIENKKICDFVAYLCRYNYTSYSAAIGVKNYISDVEIRKISDIFSDKNTFSKIGVHQLYKYLQCIRYNIDLEGWGARYENEQDNELYNMYCDLLDDLIEMLAFHIVSFTKEYQNANWCD